MLDVSHTLINKLTIKITRNTSLNSSICAADMVKGILYDRLAEIYSLTSEWKSFAIGGKLTSDDEVLKGQTVSAVLEGSSIWAVYLNVKDPESARRRWVYYIGQCAENEDTTLLYYAKCRYDHMAGSITEIKSTVSDRDILIETLFTNKHIQCTCGNHVLPDHAVELTHSNLPDFLNMLQDTTRKQPMLLVTCGWYMAPEKIADILLGNAAVFWSDNSSIVMRLNSMLPHHMYTTWESVRIFMPSAGEKTFHPIYALDDIRSMGIDKFQAGLRQAYSQSLRSEERRGFPTIESIYAIKYRQTIESLKQHLSERDTKLNTVLAQNRDLRKANQLLQEQNQLLSSAEPSKDAEAYESLLNESIKENDALRHSIQQLNSQLCSDMGMSFQPDSVGSAAIIQELAHTIHACLQRASDRK